MLSRQVSEAPTVFRCKKKKKSFTVYENSVMVPLHLKELNMKDSKMHKVGLIFYIFIFIS